MAWDDWLTVESEVMAPWLDRHGGDDGLLESFAVAGVGTQHMTQIHRMFLTETEQQTTFGGNPYSVTVAAKIVTVWRNETDAAVGSRHAVVA